MICLFVTDYLRHFTAKTPVITDFAGIAVCGVTPSAGVRPEVKVPKTRRHFAIRER
jgi:hypothetical protein